VASPAEGRRIAVFGGSFNPPHVSHVLAVAYALSTAPIDEVLVVPVFQHPFAKELASFEDRLAMCRLAMGWLPGVTISTVERELGGESKTLRTIEHLVETRPRDSFRLLIGADVVADLPKWHRFDRIRELAPPVVLGRSFPAGTPRPPGVDEREAPEAFLPAVSSTEVRDHLAAGEIDAIRARVPSKVLEYVAQRGLYRRG
jgi:nicotinate-nucleotide adenylyltransferase